MTPVEETTHFGHTNWMTRAGSDLRVFSCWLASMMLICMLPREGAIR